MPPSGDTTKMTGTVLYGSNTHLAVVQIDHTLLQSTLLEESGARFGTLHLLGSLRKLMLHCAYIVIHRDRDDTVRIIETGHVLAVIVKGRVILSNEELRHDISSLHDFSKKNALVFQMNN